MVKNFSFPKYKTYDTSQGFGNVSEWGKSFSDVMGIEEAKSRVGNDNPLFILGLTILPATLEALKTVYRKLMIANQNCHRQDATAEDQDKIKRIIAAYTLLSKRFK